MCRAVGVGVGTSLGGPGCDASPILVPACICKGLARIGSIVGRGAKVPATGVHSEGMLSN